MVLAGTQGSGARTPAASLSVHKRPSIRMTAMRPCLSRSWRPPLGGIPVGLIGSALNLTGPAWIAALLMVCCWSASSIAARLGSPE